MERRAIQSFRMKLSMEGPLDEPIGRLGSSGRVRRHRSSGSLLLFASRNRERFVGRVGQLLWPHEI